MPRLLICGDPHGYFDHIIKAVAQHAPDAVILLGDQEAEHPLHEELASVLELTQIWWIPGNHDTDEERFYDNLFSSQLADRNLHGRIVNIAGVRVAGLGGVFRRKIWDGDVLYKHESPDSYLAQAGKGNRWRGGLPLRHRSTIFPSDFDSFKNLHADILVTHEAPWPHKFGYHALNDLARTLAVKAAFHGHQHEAIAYPDQIWHGVGERGIYIYDDSK